MWFLLKALIQAEIVRLWRRMLRRPEPPGPFADFRSRLEHKSTLDSPGGGDSDGPL